MFKKLLSLVLSASVFLSTVAVDFQNNKQVVYGASGISTYKSSFSKALSEGSATNTPVNITNTNMQKENAFFEMSMEKDPSGANFSTGTYILSYPVKDNVLLNVTVDKDSDANATVTYKFTDATTGKNINYTESSTGTKDYFIYSSAVSMYQAHSAFAPNGTVASKNYVVTSKINDTTDPRDVKAISSADGAPTFHITKGTGYSFKYNGINAHIKWNDNDNTFQFYSDGFLNGNLYDVNLTYNTYGTTDALYTDSKKIFTGMNLSKGVYKGDGILTDKFMAGPFADSATDDDTSLAVTKYFSKDIVDSSTNPEGVGKEENGIRFGFTIPMEWDGKAYKKPLSAPYTMDLRMDIAGRQVNMTNILNSSLKAVVTPPSGADGYAFKATVTPVSTAGKTSDSQFYMTLSDIPEGAIFRNVSLFPTIKYNGVDKSVQYPTYTEVPYGYIFSFPKYKITKINSQLYVELEPFRDKLNDASLKSYEDVEGIYLLKTDDAPSVTQLSDGSQNMFFPITLSPDATGSSATFQIFFNPRAKIFDDIFDVDYTDYIHSEKYKYTVLEASGDLAMPENFVINDYSLSQTGDLSKYSEMTLSLDMEWNLASKASIDKMLEDSPTGEITVKYRLTNYLEPSAGSPLYDYTYVEIKLNREDPSDPDSKVMATYTLAYDEAMTNLVMPVADPVELELFNDNATNSEMYKAHVMFDVRASHKDPTPVPDPINPSPIYFEYPNIYFMTVNAIELDRDGSGPLKEEDKTAYKSTMESITLNDIAELEVPPPQNLTISNTNRTYFDLDWTLSGSGISQFLLDKYTPTQLSDISKNIGNNGATPEVNNLDVYYDLYICSYETYMKNKFSTFPLPDTKNTSTPNRKGVSYIIDGQKLTDYNIFMQDDTVTFEDGTEISGKAPSSTNGKSGLPIDYLRGQDGVVMIEHYPIFDKDRSTGDYNADTYKALQDIVDAQNVNLKNNLSLYGLDENTKYFVYADLVVVTDNADSLTAPTKRVVTSSKLSPLVGTTTLSDTTVPDDNDKIPPAPILKLVSTSVDSVKISWDPVKVINSDGTNSVIEYDIIRTEGYQIPDKFLTTRDSFKQTYDKYVPENVPSKSGYRTDIKGEFNTATPASSYEFVREYDSLADNFIKTAKAIVEPTIVTFTEKSLSPNRVYFYYVRTIRTAPDGTSSYSTWSRISGTTSNIKSPTNLTINTRYQTYEPKTEVVLNFDAPILDTTKIGVDYDFYYTIREDGGEFSAPILMNADMLRSNVVSQNQKDSITNFNYKISNLKSGTSYTFKVKMVDKGNGASSLYSNEARAKTDMDQDDYDDNTDTDNWVDFLISLLKKIFDDDYFITEDTNGKREVIYREEKFPGVIAKSTDTFVTLVPCKDNALNTYYISAKSYEMLNAKNMGLKVVYENTEYYLSPSALSDVLNGAKKDVDAEKTKDFYIKLEVSGYASGAINGEPLLSDVMTVAVSAVGFSVPIKQFERDAYAKLIASFDTDEDLESVKEKIAEYVKNNKTELEIQQILIDEIPELSKDFLSKVDTLFHNDLAGSKYNYNIENLDGQLAISLLNVDPETSANAYTKKSDNWIMQNVISAGVNRTVLTHQTGVYVFTGKVISLPGLDVPYQDTIKSLFNKYGLDAYLGSGNTFNKDAKLTGQMVMGSCARLMGMKPTDDPITFLKSKGISASERTARSTIKSGDMIYYLMKVYENKTGTKIENMNVTNYGATANMKGLTNQNKKAIQIATQIGLIKDKNFNANYEMKVIDFLYYLNALNEITKL